MTLDKTNQKKSAVKNAIWEFLEVLLKIFLVFVALGFIIFVAVMIYLYTIGF